MKKWWHAKPGVIPTLMLDNGDSFTTLSERTASSEQYLRAIILGKKYAGPIMRGKLAGLYGRHEHELFKVVRSREQELIRQGARAGA
jgi:hypothetical protein